MDDRARVMFKDQLLNMIMAGQKRLTNQVEEEDQNKPITVSTVAAQMGIVLKTTDAQKIGGQLAKMYFDKYKQAPSKHEQFVNGAMREVNSYTERDKDLVQNAIMAHINI
jgi:hypothetical protein